MSKNNISELDVVAANNADLAGISILGTGLLSTADDSFRTAASFLAKWWEDLGGVNTVGGTGDAISVTTATIYTALKTGMRLQFIASAANTTAVTLNLDAIGAKALRKISGGTDVALVAGDIPGAKFRVDVGYDAAANSAAGAWIVLGSAPVAAATTSTSGTVKLATQTEAATLTDTAKAVTSNDLTFLGGYTTTATAAGTTTLTVTDNYNQYFTGSTTQTVVLPVTSTLVLGRSFRVVNLSTGAVTVQSSGANTIAVVAPGTSAIFTCILTSGTTAASWDFKFGTTLTLGAAVASTSGTSIDFTLPAWVTRITVNTSAISTNGTSPMIIRLGTSGGFATSGYASSSANADSTTAGFLLGAGSTAAAGVYGGTATFVLQDRANNVWVQSGVLARIDTPAAFINGGYVTLSGTLTQLRLTTVNGTDAFDAGKVNITYE